MTIFDQSVVALYESPLTRTVIVETDQNLIVERYYRESEERDWSRVNYIHVPLSGKKTIVDHLKDSYE